MKLNVSEIFGPMTLISTWSFRDRNNDAEKKRNLLNTVKWVCWANDIPEAFDCSAKPC